MPIDANRLGSLVDDVGGPLRAFAATWSDSPDDLVQEAFCRLASEGTVPDRPRAWLFQVVRNLAREAWRRTRRREDREPRAAAREAVEGEHRHVEGREVAAFVGALPAELREVVVARLWGDLTFTEVAELVGASVATVHRRYHDALARLREKVEPCPRPRVTTTN